MALKQTEQEKQEEIRRKGLIKDYREVFLTPQGKRVLNDLLRRTGFFDNIFHASERMDCYASGRRSVASELMEVLDYATIEGYYDYKTNLIKTMQAKSIVKEYFPNAT